MMGMFDWITYKGVRYQTKDTPDQLLTEYEIRDDGTLWAEKSDDEWTVDDRHPLGTCIIRNNIRWEPCTDVDGKIVFYHYATGEPEQVLCEQVFESLFMAGRLLKIKQTRGEPLTMWLQEGIEGKNESLC